MDPTHRLLQTAIGPGGVTALAWAFSPIPVAARVLVLTPSTVSVAGWQVGADPAALPVATDAVDGAVLLLALAGLADIDAVMTQLRRVLRPSGTLVVLVPSATPRSVAELRSPLRAAHRAGWAHRSALDRAGWLLAAADFALLGDERMPFSLTRPDPATLREAGLWPPSGAALDVPRLLPAPMRRLVARR